MIQTPRGQRCIGCPGGMDCILPRCIVLPSMPYPPPLPPDESGRHSSTVDPWIGEAATGTGCRCRHAPGWPACGAPVTIHVLSESAVDGMICLEVCERHAPVAREAGVYVDEHSPSFPDCVCQPLPSTTEPTRVPVRRPYDPALTVRFLARYPHLATAPNIYIHYPIPGTDPVRGLCGSNAYEALHAHDWRLISCPDCRVTEIP